MADKFSKLLKDRCKRARDAQAATNAEKKKSEAEKDEQQAQQRRDELIQGVRESLSMFADGGVNTCILSFTPAEARIIMVWAEQEGIDCAEGLTSSNSVGLIFGW